MNMADVRPYRCDLCWQEFDGPGDLAAHEQDEHDRFYVIDGAE